MITIIQQLFTHKNNNMDHAEFAKYFNFCNEKLHIKFYPVINGSGATCRIARNEKGIESFYQTYYNVQENKPQNPKWWIDIATKYKQYYELNFQSKKEKGLLK